MNLLDKLWVIAKHIYKKQVKSIGFIMLVFAPILFSGIVIAIGYFASNYQGTSNNHIMIVTQSQEVVETLRASDTNNTLAFTKDLKKAETALKNNEINAYATISQKDTDIKADVFVLSTNDNLDLSTEEAALNTYHQTLMAKDIGLDAQTLQNLFLSKVSFHRNNVMISNSGDISYEKTDMMGQMIKLGVAYAIVMLLFVMMIFYIQIIAEELAKEKGTRVMEIILSSMSASNHFYGKLLGVLMMLATHVTIYLFIGVVAFLLNRQFHWLDLSILKTFNIDLGAMIQSQIPMILWSVGFAFAGLFTYLALTGFFSSLATKSEDAQKLNTPMTLTMVIGLYIGMFALNSPYNIVVKAASFIPFWTPFIMPFRIATDSVKLPQLIISLVVSFIFAIICFKFATLFYQSNVLTYSDKNIAGRIRQSYNLLKSERQAHKS